MENLKDAIKPFQSRKEFDEWETNLMFLLKSKGLWIHIKDMRPTSAENAKENVRDDPAYQARVKDALKDNDKIVGIIGRSVLVDIKITIKNIEYADELLDFLKKYHSLDGTSC
jgi:hypothetical protein